MYRKAKELFENCGVAVTLVTHYRGVYHFYNTCESGIKTVFEEYLEAFKTSPESFVVEVPDISTPADKKTQDANQVLQHGKTTCVDALEVPDFLADIGDLEMNMLDLDEINANFYAGGSILPAIVAEKKIVPACAHSMPCEGRDISKKTPCETFASVNASEEAPRVDKQRVDKQAHKEARIQARKEARKQARIEQEITGQKVLVTTKKHSSCLPVSKCDVKTCGEGNTRDTGTAGSH